MRRSLRLPEVIPGKEEVAEPEVLLVVAAQARHRLEIAEPAMLLVMGAVVGILVSSLILPIFQLSRAVG